VALSAIDAGGVFTSCDGFSSGGGVPSADGARLEPLAVSTAICFSIRSMRCSIRRWLSAIAIKRSCDAGGALTSCDGFSSGGGVPSVDGARIEPSAVSTVVALASLLGVGFRDGAAKVSSVSVPEYGGTDVEDDMLSALPALEDFI
jgi:hypothetical protein